MFPETSTTAPRAIPSATSDASTTAPASAIAIGSASASVSARSDVTTAVPGADGPERARPRRLLSRRPPTPSMPRSLMLVG